MTAAESRLSSRVMGMSPPRLVVDLVERFDRDRRVFLSPDYREEQLRAEFLGSA